MKLMAVKISAQITCGQDRRIAASPNTTIATPRDHRIADVAVGTVHDELTRRVPWRQRAFALNRKATQRPREKGEPEREQRQADELDRKLSDAWAERQARAPTPRDPQRNQDRHGERQDSNREQVAKPGHVIVTRGPRRPRGRVVWRSAWRRSGFNHKLDAEHVQHPANLRRVGMLAAETDELDAFRGGLCGMLTRAPVDQEGHDTVSDDRRRIRHVPREPYAVWPRSTAGDDGAEGDACALARVVTFTDRGRPPPSATSRGRRRCRCRTSAAPAALAGRHPDPRSRGKTTAQAPSRHCAYRARNAGRPQSRAHRGDGRARRSSVQVQGGVDEVV